MTPGTFNDLTRPTQHFLEDAAVIAMDHAWPKAMAVVRVGVRTGLTDDEIAGIFVGDALMQHQIRLCIQGVRRKEFDNLPISDTPQAS